MGTVISTSTTNFNKQTQVLIQKVLEEELRNPLQYLLPGNFRQANFVPGTNGTMRFLRVADMDVTVAIPAVAGTPPFLTEGTAPTTEDLTLGYEEFSAHQTGRILKITDVALLQSVVDLMGTAAERIARNAIAIADKNVALIVNAGTNVLYADADHTWDTTARNQLTAADVLDGLTLKRAVATLEIDNVPKFPDGSYHAIINPAAKFDLMIDTAVGGWIDAARYAGAKQLMNGEIGEYAGVRFVQSPVGNKFAAGGSSSANVYSTIVFGPDAYAFGDFGQIEVHLTPPGGGSDPLFQRALIGWKGYFGAVVIGEGDSATSASGPRYVRIESGTAFA